MAKAKDNTKYAVIVNGKVAQIFDSTEIKEWDENTINAVEIPQNENISINDGYDSITNTFQKKSLEEIKAQFLENVNFLFEREKGYMQGNVAQGEIESWVTQLREAKELKANPKAQTPLLTQIAKTRNMDIKTLADKVIAKNVAFNEKLGQLIGNRQKLEKEIQNAKDLESLEKIKYISPFASKE